jgi:long-chain fatty acid transport protein
VKRTVLLLLVPHAALAGGLAVGDQNAVSAATGGAGPARAADPGAAWHDPAALADDGGWRVGLSLALAKPSLEARANDGSWTASTTGGWSTPPHLDASFAHDHWAAGLAVGVPFGGDISWPAMWVGSAQAIETKLVVVRAAPFVAWRFGVVRVAAGFHVDAGRLQLERGLDFIDTQGDVRLDLTGHGLGGDASVYWQARSDLAIAASYRGRTHLAFSGPVNFTTPDAFAGKTPDQHAATRMTLPDTVTLGARWTRDAVTLVGDLEYTHWSSHATTIVAFEDPQTPASVEIDQWHDTVALRGGAEYTPGAAQHRLTVRGGGYWDPSPVPAEHLVPTSPDSSRIGLTTGASWRLGQGWAADVFGERIWLLRRETTSTDTMPASYGGTAIVVGAGLRFTR